MTDISRIVNVVIERGGIQVTRAGFGIPLIVSENTVIGSRLQYFNSLQELLDVGFTTTSNEFLTARALLQQSPQVSQFGIGRIDTDDANITESLLALTESEGGDLWYGLILLNKDEAVVIEAANFIETQRRQFFTSSDAEGIADLDTTNDLASVVMDLGLTKTNVLFHSSAGTSFPEAAWIGDTFPSDPGSLTFKFRNLTGFAPDGLTSGQISALQSKNANFYVSIGGVPNTCDGTVAVGEFIDVIRDIDALQADIEESVFQMLSDNDRVPFTDAGFALVENQIRGALARGVANGTLASPDGIIPAFTIRIPSILNISQSDRAQRMLCDVEFDAFLAGAIHFVKIRGTVSV